MKVNQSIFSYFLLLFVFICVVNHTYAMTSDGLVQNQQGFQVYTRDVMSLNGEWKAIVDPYENGFYNYRYEAFDQSENPSRNAFFMDSKANSPGDLIEYDFNQSLSINVPGDWNTQFEKLYYYEGSVWYRKLFDAPKEFKKLRQFLYFSAINYKSDVYLNGKKLGTHIGGFTPFYFEVSSKLKEKNNSLVIKVDNKRMAEGVPTLNTDWWNYGGITRDVSLVTVPQNFIRDYQIQLLDHTTKRVSLKVYIDSEYKDKKSKQKVTLSLPELGHTSTAYTDLTGEAVFTVSLPTATLWSPENPKRYQLKLTTAEDNLQDRIGLRTISSQGKKLLLNGKEIFLRGISIHEEYAVQGGGRVKNRDEAKKLIKWSKELNSNFIRLAHYPHSEHMVREAEAQGLLVWSEVPVYWTIQWKNKETYRNAAHQINAMVQRDKNRAAVIIWSLANETPVSDYRNHFLEKLAKRVRELDSSRLLSAAMEKHGKQDDSNVSIVEDPLAQWVDIVSFNQYLGWYWGTADDTDQTRWQIEYDKPVFVSEFGAGARAGLHGDKYTRWTEEYQEYLYSKTLNMLEKIDGFVGTSPWALTDFRSPRRLLIGIQDDFNRKGLISEVGEKKKAFYVLRDFYKRKEDKPHR